MHVGALQDKSADEIEEIWLKVRAAAALKGEGDCCWARWLNHPLATSSRQSRDEAPPEGSAHTQPNTRAPSPVS